MRNKRSTLLAGLRRALRAAFPFCTGFFCLASLAGCGLGNADLRCGTEVQDPDENLAGCVVDDQGNPAVAATVTLVPVDGSALAKGASQSLDTAARIAAGLPDSVLTDPVGRFHFRSLPPGRYSLFFTDASGTKRGKVDGLHVLPSNGSGSALTGSFQSVGFIRLKPEGILLVNVHELSSGSDQALDSVECSIPGTPYKTLSTRSGACVFNLPPVSDTEGYTVRCHLNPLPDVLIKNLAVRSNETNDTVAYMGLPSGQPYLPAPASLSATYDSVSGIVRLKWPSVGSDEVFDYEVKRVDGTNSDWPIFPTVDTAFNDVVFHSAKDSATRDLYYSVRSHKKNSVVYSQWIFTSPRLLRVNRPAALGADIVFTAWRDGKAFAEGDTAGAGDTLRIVGAYDNALRLNTRLDWTLTREAHPDSLWSEKSLSARVGSDTLNFICQQAGDYVFKLTLTDEMNVTSSRTFGFYARKP